MVNGPPKRRDVAVVGASAGGVVALQTLFRALPDPPPGVIVVVLHRSPFFEGMLPAVLGARTAHLVLEPEQHQPVERGRIYVAPRDRHLVFDGGRFALNREPKQHHTRPAIDPLFRSAAATYGARVVGVVLTGGGDDGADGLLAIKHAGGVSIAQDPEEAPHPWMPRSAIVYDHVDLVLPVDEIATALVALARGERVPTARKRRGAVAG
jgi:two-component system chemotaxis response regulator CheB